MQSLQYGNLKEFPPDNLELMTRMEAVDQPTSSGCLLAFAQKMREVPSIVAWVNCFRQYLAILAKSEAESCALRALIHPRTNPKPCNMPALSTFPSHYSKGKRQGLWVQFPIASSGTEGNAQGKCVDIDTPATQAQGTTMPQSAKDWGRLNL